MLSSISAEYGWTSAFSEFTGDYMLNGHFVSQTRKLNHRYQSHKGGPSTALMDMIIQINGLNLIAKYREIIVPDDIISDNLYFDGNVPQDGWLPYLTFINYTISSGAFTIDTRTFGATNNPKLKFTQDMIQLQELFNGVDNTGTFNVPFRMCTMWVDVTGLTPYQDGNNRWFFNGSAIENMLRGTKITGQSFDFVYGMNEVNIQTQVLPQLAYLNTTPILTQLGTGDISYTSHVKVYNYTDQGSGDVFPLFEMNMGTGGNTYDCTTILNANGLAFNAWGHGYTKGGNAEIWAMHNGISYAQAVMSGIGGYVYNLYGSPNMIELNSSLAGGNVSLKALDISANREVTARFIDFAMIKNTSISSDFTETWRMNT